MATVQRFREFISNSESFDITRPSEIYQPTNNTVDYLGSLFKNSLATVAFTTAALASSGQVLAQDSISKSSAPEVQSISSVQPNIPMPSPNFVSDETETAVLDIAQEVDLAKSVELPVELSEDNSDDAAVHISPEEQADLDDIRKKQEELEKKEKDRLEEIANRSPLRKAVNHIERFCDQPAVRFVSALFTPVGVFCGSAYAIESITKSVKANEAGDKEAVYSNLADAGLSFLKVSNSAYSIPAAGFVNAARFHASKDEELNKLTGSEFKEALIGTASVAAVGPLSGLVTQAILTGENYRHDEGEKFNDGVRKSAVKGAGAIGSIALSEKLGIDNVRIDNMIGAAAEIGANIYLPKFSIMNEKKISEEKDYSVNISNDELLEKIRQPVAETVKLEDFPRDISKTSAVDNKDKTENKLPLDIDKVERTSSQLASRMKTLLSQPAQKISNKMRNSM